MTFLLTLVLTFLLVFAASCYFLIQGPPVYRVEKVNIIRLLELVLSGEAEPRDWEVFVAYPIRHDEDLAAIQARLLDIAEREYLGDRDRLFTRQGMAELAVVLDELKAG